MPLKRWWLGLACGVLLLSGLRLFALGNHVLFDTTEARYGEVARLMLVTGDWVTPQNELGVPFWAKPPLYAWAGAASMQLLGVSEWAVRLPSVLFSALTLAIVWAWALGLQARAGFDAPQSRQTSAAACAILGSMALFFVSAGAIMTEATLLLCTTGMLACFWFSVVQTAPAQKRWAWGFFVFAGLGMLAKGPVAWVYAGLPIAAWVVIQRQWVRTWQQLPWIRGTALTLLICAPWYVAAEMRTPGYWAYFFIGEHFKRFTQPGWSGDMYGNAHIEPRGTIWIFLLAGALPWTFLAVGQVGAWLKRCATRTAEKLDASDRFLILCTLAPLVFFTLSRNIIWTYTLPALPALAILLARRWAFTRAFLATFAVGLLALGVYFVAVLPGLAQERSAAQTVAAWHSAQSRAPGPLVFIGSAKPPHSAKFYSRAQALGAPTADATLRMFPGARVYLAWPAKRQSSSASTEIGTDELLRNGLIKPVSRSSAYALYVFDPSSTATDKAPAKASTKAVD